MKEISDLIEHKYPIVWRGERLRVEYGNYAINNSVSIQLMYWDEEDKAEYPYMTASVYAEGVELEHDEIVIKDYSENEGVLALLVQHNVVSKPHGTVPLGFVFGDICQLVDHEDLG